MSDIIKIGTAEIPLAAQASSASNESADHPHENLFFGNSSVFWKRGSAGVSSTIDFDLGSGNAKSVDFAFFRGVNLMLAQASGEVDISLRGSTDNFSASNDVILSASNLETSDLMGVRNEDLLLTGSASAAYRYWRIQIDSDTSFEHVLRKAYFGMLFDFLGKSPSYPYVPGYSAPLRAFVADSGTVFRTSQHYRRREYSLRWRGVTDNARAAFDSRIRANIEDCPVVLVESGSGPHSVLDGAECILGWIDGAEVSSSEHWVDLNTVSLMFVEDLV